MKETTKSLCKQQTNSIKTDFTPLSSKATSFRWELLGTHRISPPIGTPRSVIPTRLFTEDPLDLNHWLSIRGKQSSGRTPRGRRDSGIRWGRRRSRQNSGASWTVVTVPEEAGLSLAGLLQGKNPQGLPGGSGVCELCWGRGRGRARPDYHGVSVWSVNGGSGCKAAGRRRGKRSSCPQVKAGPSPCSAPQDGSVCTSAPCTRRVEVTWPPACPPGSSEG